MSNIAIKIANLKNRLRDICTEDTCPKSAREDWSPANPFFAHCAPIAAIVYKKLGGEIIRGIVAETGYSHYWNKIDDVEYDLTKEQFCKRVVTLVEAQPCTIERVLNNSEAMESYTLLLQKLEELPEVFNDHKPVN